MTLFKYNNMLYKKFFLYIFLKYFFLWVGKQKKKKICFQISNYNKIKILCGNLSCDYQ